MTSGGWLTPRDGLRARVNGLLPALPAAVSALWLPPASPVHTLV